MCAIKGCGHVEEDGGGAVLIHKARGRTSNNRLEAGVREYALELVRSNYRDFGPTLAVYLGKMLNR